MATVTGIAAGREVASTVLRPKIREASFEDYEGVVALQLRNGLATRSYSEWLALWKGNPAYEQLGRQSPIGWILESPQGEVGGFIGNLSLAYQWKGRQLHASSAYSWTVDQQHRGYSMALLDCFLRQNNVDLFVCTTVNSTAETVFRALRFSRVPSGTWDTSGFWVTKYRDFAKSALKAASIPSSPLLVAPLSAALYLRDTLSFNRSGLSADCELETCAGFDERFDAFWEQLQREQSNSLLAVRTRETLEWHYRRSLSKGEAWIFAISRGDRLVAYAVFDRQDHPALDLKRVRLVDFQALAGYEQTIRQVLACMLHKCRAAGIHIAENVGCSLDRLKVRAAEAPYRRKMKSWVFYYRAREADLSAVLQDPEVWAPSSFDGDASL